jgi:hypothetical protein
MAIAENRIFPFEQQAPDFLTILPPILRCETPNYVVKVRVGLGAVVKG